MNPDQMPTPSSDSNINAPDATDATEATEMSRALQTAPVAPDKSKVLWRAAALQDDDNSDTHCAPLEEKSASDWRWRWEMWRSRFFVDWHSQRVTGSVLFVSLLIALGLLPQVLNFARRDDLTRDIVFGAWLWQPLEALEYRLYEARFAARGPRVPLSASKIAIVAIDQDSLTRFGDWPWPRDRHAQLIRRLQKAGARVVAIDLDFSSYQSPIRRGGQTILSSQDRDLVAAVEGGRTIFASPMTVERRGRSTVVQMNTPFEELDAATPDLSLAFVKTDSDGRLRSFPVYGQINGAELSGLAPLAVGLFQNRLDGDQNTAFYAALKSGQWANGTKKSQVIPLHSIRLNSERLWLTPLFFYGPPGTFSTYGYAAVLHDYSPARLKKMFEGRSVFVGATAPILKDLFAVPNLSAAGDDAESQMPGVEMHATLAAQMLDGDWIRASSTQSTLMALFGLSLLSSLWIGALNEPISRLARAAQRGWARRNWPGRVHSLTWFGLYSLVAWWPLLAFWQWTIWLFSARGVWLPALYPLLGGALSAGAALLLMFVVEAGERRKVLAHFGRTVSRDVLEEILATHEEDFRAPRRVEATVLFSDLEGFTSYSEEREPEEVVQALNLYMDYMAPIVEAHGGSIDKYIGDAIMAFWNAPLPRYDHAAQALMCAVAMQDECARFRRETGIPFYMRIGVHSGPCLYGDVGSQGRSNVTVIGDTVNIAARLEGKNKEFGSWIMCSQSTFEAAPNAVEADFAAAQIKGKSQQVEVYMVRGPHGAPNREQQWAHIKAADNLPELGDASRTLSQSRSNSSLSIENDSDAALPQLTEGNAANRRS